MTVSKRQKVECGLQGLRQSREGELVFNGGWSVGENEKVLERDGGDVAEQCEST